MDNDVLTIDELLSLDRGANCVEFNLGFLHLCISAGPEVKPFFQFYGHPMFNIGDKVVSGWEAHTRKLIGKRMRGELISNYIPGYEPKDL